MSELLQPRCLRALWRSVGLAERMPLVLMQRAQNKVTFVTGQTHTWLVKQGTRSWSSTEQLAGLLCLHKAQGWVLGSGRS